MAHRRRTGGRLAGAARCIFFEPACYRSGAASWQRRAEEAKRQEKHCCIAVADEAVANNHATAGGTVAHAATERQQSPPEPHQPLGGTFSRRGCVTRGSPGGRGPSSVTTEQEGGAHDASPRATILCTAAPVRRRSRRGASSNNLFLFGCKDKRYLPALRSFPPPPRPPPPSPVLHHC